MPRARCRRFPFSCLHCICGSPTKSVWLGMKTLWKKQWYQASLLIADMLRPSWIVSTKLCFKNLQSAPKTIQAMPSSCESSVKPCSSQGGPLRPSRLKLLGSPNMLADVCQWHLISFNNSISFIYIYIYSMIINTLHRSVCALLLAHWPVRRSRGLGRSWCSNLEWWTSLLLAARIVEG